MCGLVGVAGFIGQNEERAFLNLLEVDTQRGPHSTGIAFVRRYDKANKVVVKKTVGTPWDFYREVNMRPLLTNIHSCMIGHNRWATKGAITAENAHPFEFEHVVGAHNGTLVNQSLLIDHKKFVVDSENLYHHINEKGIRDALMHTHGAFALTWYDKRNNTINFTRNDQRPLFYTMSEDNRSLFWASEEWMLHSQLRKNRIAYKPLQEVAVNQLYTFEIPEKGVDSFDKVRISTMEVYTPPKKPPVVGNHVWSNYSSDMDEEDNWLLGIRRHQTQVTQQQKNNVIYIPPKKNTTLEMTAKVGTQVRLRLISVKQEGNQQYVSARGVDSPLLVTRLYIQTGTRLWDELGLADGVAGIKVTAILKSVNLQGEYYTADLRTVKLMPQEALLFKVSGGRMVDRRTFEDLVENGCDWCSGPITPEDQHTIAWGAGTEVFCKNCKGQPEVEAFVTKH